MTIACLFFFIPLAGLAQRTLTQEQESVYDILKEFDGRVPMPYSLSESYLTQLTTSGSTVSRIPQKKEYEKIVRVLTIGEDEQLCDLLDVGIEEVDSLKLMGHVHQADLQMIRGNIYPKGHPKFDPSLPWCSDYRLSGIDLAECEIEGDSLPSYTFGGKTLLENIRLPEGLTEICQGAFSATGSLAFLSLPSTLQRLGRVAFDRSGIPTINLPESVEEIGEMCFYGSMLKSFKMQGVPRECGSNIFLASSLEEASLPDDLEEIYSGMFQHTPLKSLQIPEGVKTIGEGAFNFCIFLKVELPESVERIGSRAFASNVSAKEFVITDYVEDIDSLAFFNSGLRSVTIGESVKSIGLGCFAQNKLQYVYCKALQPPFVPDPVEGSYRLCLPFYNDPSRMRQDAVLLVPRGAKELYQNAFCWKEFSEIIEVDDDENARERMEEHTGIRNASAERDTTIDAYSTGGIHLKVSSLQEIPSGVFVVHGKRVVIK